MRRREMSMWEEERGEGGGSDAFFVFFSFLIHIMYWVEVDLPPPSSSSSSSLPVCMIVNAHHHA